MEENLRRGLEANFRSDKSLGLLNGMFRTFSLISQIINSDIHRRQMTDMELELTQPDKTLFLTSQELVPRA